MEDQNLQPVFLNMGFANKMNPPKQLALCCLALGVWGFLVGSFLPGIVFLIIASFLALLGENDDDWTPL